jgi:putative ABC transport system ATP-binding protein
VSDEPILKVENVGKTYGSNTNTVHALKGVTAELHMGEVLAIFGPSGSGKTTFLMIAGLVDVPSTGRVLFKEQVIATPSTELGNLRTFRRNHIGFVFQRSNLIPFMTAVENVQVAMQLNGVSNRVANDHAWHLLHQLKVDHRGDAMPQQLSGGEQQRVAIARALANRPALLFADEPTGALDSERGREVMALFRELADTDGVAICVVTHDPRAVNLFDRIIEMADGEIGNEYLRRAGAPIGEQVGVGSLLGPLFDPDSWHIRSGRPQAL